MAVIALPPRCKARPFFNKGKTISFRVCLRHTTLRIRGNDAWDVLAVVTHSQCSESTRCSYVLAARVQTQPKWNYKFCRVRLVAKDSRFSSCATGVRIPYTTPHILPR
jgi:hypothetical protein